jgi:hypothetical protein
MDVHVPRAITTGLRMRGIHVLTSQQDGTTELDDDLLLLRATALGCILVTQDTDLLHEGSKLLARGTPFAGIVYAHQLRTNIGEMVDDLELIARAMSMKSGLEG